MSFFQDAKKKKTLKKTRKFIVDGVEVSVTTSKIITDNDTKNEEMRFLRCLSRLHSNVPGKWEENQAERTFSVMSVFLPGVRS